MQFSLPEIRDGLWHRTCGQPIDVRPVMRFADLEIVEMAPYCELCGRFVPVKELI